MYVLSYSCFYIIFLSIHWGKLCIGMCLYLLCTCCIHSFIYYPPIKSIAWYGQFSQSSQQFLSQTDNQVKLCTVIKQSKLLFFTIYSILSYRIKINNELSCRSFLFSKKSWILFNLVCQLILYFLLSTALKSVQDIASPTDFKDKTPIHAQPIQQHLHAHICGMVRSMSSWVLI